MFDPLMHLAYDIIAYGFFLGDLDQASSWSDRALAESVPIGQLHCGFPR